MKENHKGAPYKAVDVARYIISKANESGDVLTNPKLQCLLYYLQAWYMVHHGGKRLFSDDIKATRYGVTICPLSSITDEVNTK
jgi:uncharacterized phage-associated protein